MKKHLLLFILLCCATTMLAQLPFTDTFPSEDDFQQHWTVINPGGDWCKWECYTYATASDDGTGCASCGSWGDEANNDWLILRTPLTLKAGAHHMTFYARETPDDNPELLEVLFGTEADTTAMKAGQSAMTVIGDFAIANSEWRLKAINFDVPADGDYYFAFHSKTEGAYMLTLDDLTIDEGTYQTSPELSIVKTLLPYSNCDLSEESPVGVRLTNTGTGAASTFTLSFTVNGGETVTETFTDALAPDKTKDYYFQHTANLLDLGDYTVGVTLTCDGQTSTAEGKVSHYAPITELPLETDFYADEGVSDTWTMLTDNAWTYSSWSGYYECQKTGLDGAMLSHCITMNNPFRVKIAYTGGSYYGPSGFYMAYGRPGTDISTWTKVYEDDNVTDYVETEFTVTPSEPGDYNLVVVDNSSSEFKMTCVYQIVISELLEHDVRIESARSPLAACVPANHLNATHTVTSVVTNRGTATATGLTVSVAKDGTTLATSPAVATLAAGDSATLSAPVTLQGVKAGDDVMLTLVASMTDTDEYAADNTLTLPETLATDTVFATEQMTDFEQGTGAYSDTIAFGNVYTLAETDTLTSVSVGLTSSYWGEEGDEFGLRLYSLKADGTTIDRQLLDATYERKTDGGLQTCTFAPRVLPAGSYFFEVAQIKETMLGVSYEESTDGLCYQNVDGTLQPTEGAFLAIRANFAHNAKAYAKNVAVRAITQPEDDSALFSASETIAAVVENIGSETATNVTLTCSAGSVSASQTLTLQPYEKRTVAFEDFDLSTPGQYVITLTATLAGDEDTSDNTLLRTVTSEEEQSPYVLDFESCKDFATGHGFNPRWWTENRHAANPTDGFWRFDYPHNSEEGAGFMAFNVTATTPDMTTLDESEQVPGFFAHDGERFGAAFCVAQDWNLDIDYDLTSDTWLVSPQLQLSTNSALELYVKTHAIESQEIELEKYRLLVSDTDDAFDSFTVLGGDREAPTDWTRVTADLSAYDGKKVYVAVQYVGQIFKNVVMMVDDIRVTTDGVATGVTAADHHDVRVSLADGTLSVTSDDAFTSVQVTDASGKTLTSADGLCAHSYTTPVPSLAQGVYVVRVDSTVKKVVVR